MELCGPAQGVHSKAGSVLGGNRQQSGPANRPAASPSSIVRGELDFMLGPVGYSD